MALKQYRASLKLVTWSPSTAESGWHVESALRAAPAFSSILVYLSRQLMPISYWFALPNGSILQFATLITNLRQSVIRAPQAERQAD
jgi:hypothetical protein